MTVIQPPGAFGSALAALNDAGQAVGAYYDAAGDMLLLANKSMIPLDVPSQVLGFQIKGIDNGGDVIGTYTDPDKLRATASRL